MSVFKSYTLSTHGIPLTRPIKPLIIALFIQYAVVSKVNWDIAMLPNLAF
jgi:hypothetical protein